MELHIVDRICLVQGALTGQCLCPYFVRHLLHEWRDRGFGMFVVSPSKAHETKKRWGAHFLNTRPVGQYSIRPGQSLVSVPW